jgi:hypothetical protein
MGEIRNTYKVAVREIEWKNPLGKYRHSWEDNIKMKIGCVLNLTVSGYGLMVSSYGHDNNTSASIKGG